MITSPTVSVLRNSTNPAWESGSSGEKGAEKISQHSVHNSVSPADPSRQASRLPIKVLKMLTARAGHLLHPEYLQPLPSTPVSPIEVSTSIFGKTFRFRQQSVSLRNHWTPELKTRLCCSGFVVEFSSITSDNISLILINKYMCLQPYFRLQRHYPFFFVRIKIISRGINLDSV